MRWILVVVGINLVLPMMVFGQTPSSADLIANAKDLVEKEDYSNAVALLDKVSIQHAAPAEIVEVYLTMATIARKQGDIESLVYYISKADDRISEIHDNEYLRHRVDLLKIEVSTYDDPAKSLKLWRDFLKTPSLDKALFNKAVVNVGVCHLLLKSYDSAIYFFDVAIPYYKNIGGYSLSNLYQNKAFAIDQLGVTDSALFLINESIRIAKKIRSQEYLLDGMMLLASHHLKQNHLDSAKVLLDSAKHELKDSRLIKSRYVLAGFYYDYYAAKKDYPEAIRWLDLQGKLKDSLTDNKLDIKLELLKSRRKVEQQENAITRSRNIVLAVSVGLMLTVIIIFLLIRLIRLNNRTTKILAAQNEKIQSINEELSEKNNEIKFMNEALTTINDSLEESVKNRTQILESQNAQLTEYAFINSHLLRAPIARILGLSQLLTCEDTSIRDAALVDALFKSTNELDEIVKKISEILYEGNNLTREDIKAIIERNFKEDRD